MRILYTVPYDKYNPEVYVSDIVRIRNLNADLRYRFLDKVLKEFTTIIQPLANVSKRDFYSFHNYAEASQKRENRDGVTFKEVEEYFKLEEDAKSRY